LLNALQNMFREPRCLSLRGFEFLRRDVSCTYVGSYKLTAGHWKTKKIHPVLSATVVKSN